MYAFYSVDEFMTGNKLPTGLPPPSPPGCTPMAGTASGTGTCFSLGNKSEELPKATGDCGSCHKGLSPPLHQGPH
ncbi:hypothetical protein J6590_059313 [Homalodisca vitripennis]|nr:hypothetical protein J6590_059313 [Homalodisca vitripennis]